MSDRRRIIDQLINQDKQRFKHLYKFISQGVKIVDPLTTHIAEDVKIAKGTTIFPMTVIEPDVRIGKNCSIGPFTRLRSGTRLKDGVTAGNFVEIVRSNIRSKSKVKHLTYIGDTTIEENVNIGAGTIIANYDGNLKHKTRICQGAFIGSGTILISPLKVGRNAITGAGAVVTRGKNVPDDTVVVGVPAKILRRITKVCGDYRRVCVMH